VPPESAAGDDSLSSRDILETSKNSLLTQPQHLSVSPALFQKFQRLIYAETGIWLNSAKTALLCGRLFRRLRALGMNSLKSYYECVSRPEEHEERARMIDAITTNETRFFREPRQFDFLVQTVFPRWQLEADQGLRQRRVRIWSAGCSSGEEPYTVAMLAAQHLPADKGWDAQILATDISNRVLERACKGVYPIAKAAELPKDLLRSFMLRGKAEREGEMKVKVEIQRMIDFRRLNLNEEPNLSESPFHAIFCRNVLIYFDAQSKQRVVTNLVRHLAAGGFLFVGHAETLSSMSAELRSLEPTIYTKIGTKASEDRTKEVRTKEDR
jgi:chemotaxis protein methyltransferase CheR